MGLTMCYKTTVFTIYICSFYLIYFTLCILLHKLIYGYVKKQTEVILEYYFWFRFFCESNHRRYSYDVINVFKMAAVDVANQLPVPV